MKKLARIIPVITIALFVYIFVQSQVFVSAKTEDKRISEGIYIEELYVGGMTADEAREALDVYLMELGETEFTLQTGEHQLVFTANELGLIVSEDRVIEEAIHVGKTGSLLKRYKDLKDLEQGDLILDLNKRIDRDTVAALLNENLSKIEIEAVDNGLVRKNGEFVFVEGKNGITVNVEASADLVVDYVATEWYQGPETIMLSAEIMEPKGSKEELSKVKDLLGSYHTNFSSSSSARATNVELATSRIDGSVLYPGEEFSVNEAILPRDAANGYEIAASYSSGTTVQSYGGGVCQVSTTLYNTVILAELDVTERSNHSMTVSYVPLSMDAAIAGDYMDLKFVNNTDAPIYIEGYTKNRNLYFNIYGEETRASNRKISYESEIVSTQDPGTRFVATGDPIGTVRQVQSKHTGYSARLWKIETVDGVVVSKTQFNKSNYRSSPRIVNVGTASENPDAAAAVAAAVATGNEAAIYAAIGSAQQSAE